MAFREVFWNISYGYLVYVLAVITLAIWLFIFYRRYKLWRQGRPDERLREIGKRIGFFIKTAIVDIFVHRKFLRQTFSGIMHLSLFWGFIILLLASAVDAVSYYSGYHLKGAPYLWFSLISDLGGFLILLGILMAALRRYLWKPKSLNTFLDDGIILGSIAAIILTGYMIEGLRQAATEIKPHPDWAVWSPGGWVFAKIFMEMGEVPIRFWHKCLWWFHSALTLGAILYSGLAFSKLQHIIVSPLNIFFRSLGPVGAPLPIDIEKAEILGVGNIKDFTWKQLLDLDACTNCGRCEDVCPAWATGKPLSPRKLIQDLKVHMIRPSESLSSLIGEAPNEAEIWSCTTCAACQEACPVYVEHILKVIDLRRHLVLVQNSMPESAQLMLRNMQMRGHPWAGAQSLRLRGDWTSDLDLKVLSEGDQISTLFWVGCTGALVDRNVEVTTAITRVFKEVGVDFGVLGEAETCCGDPARRAGYEFQFQIIAEQNIEIFKNHHIQEIITSCPHCYNILKNEYPKYGGHFKVIHYTQLLWKLIKEGRLNLSHEFHSNLTYHDPCYLGRYNGIYQEPRQILKKIPKAKLIEMERAKERSFCCGGGGGHMWIEEQPGTMKISKRRIEDVLKTGVDRVITTCPYCLQMFEESIENKDALKAEDLIEVVERAMKYR
ncbi:MAG: (Fe-S)-binding protein [Thermodesulfobacteriota bacterium]